METTAINKNKSNAFKLSEQVKSILHNRGLSKAFNYNDYAYFKTQCANAFNKPLAIAEKFINEYEQESDLNQYIF